MNTIDVYLKIITLLVREIELGEENENDNSKDLIRTVLGLNKNKKANNLMGGESTLVTDLKDLILSINNAADTYTKEMVINSLKLILKDRKDVSRGIINGIDYKEWNPETDKDIISTYSVDNMEGKKLTNLLSI